MDPSLKNHCEQKVSVAKITFQFIDGVTIAPLNINHLHANRFILINLHTRASMFVVIFKITFNVINSDYSNTLDFFGFKKT